jgi:hypothetical protein
MKPVARALDCLGCVPETLCTFLSTLCQQTPHLRLLAHGTRASKKVRPLERYVPLDSSLGPHVHAITHDRRVMLDLEALQPDQLGPIVLLISRTTSTPGTLAACHHDLVEVWDLNNRDDATALEKGLQAIGIRAWQSLREGVRNPDIVGSHRAFCFAVCPLSVPLRGVRSLWFYRQSTLRLQKKVLARCVEDGKGIPEDDLPAPPSDNEDRANDGWEGQVPPELEPILKGSEPLRLVDNQTFIAEGRQPVAPLPCFYDLNDTSLAPPATDTASRKVNIA